MNKTKLLKVSFVWVLVQQQAKRRSCAKQILGKGLIYRPVRLNKLVDSLLDRSFIAQVDG